MTPEDKELVEEIDRFPYGGHHLLAYAILRLVRAQQHTALHLGEKLDRLADAIESIGEER